MSGRYGDPPDELTDCVRTAVASLPEVEEQKAWAGTRWQVRRRTFAQVLALNDTRQSVLTFRAAGLELDALAAMGHPFFVLGWGRDVLGMVLDDDTDWDEVAELLTESYCVLAPKRLAAAVVRPTT